MQLQADIAGRPVLRARDTELSALGVAHLAGVGAGVWSWDDLNGLPRSRDRFQPASDPAARAHLRDDWRAAISRARYRPPHAAASVPAAITR